MKQGIFRNARTWGMWGIAILVILWYLITDPDGGAETVARIQHLAWVTVILGLVWIGRRVLNEKVKLAEVAAKALKDPVGAGLVYLGACIVMAALVVAYASRANAHELPPRAPEGLPVLAHEIAGAWPDMPTPSVLGALVDKETCAGRMHPKCWNPRAELRTSREYGFGLGQLTVAYRADGSERFNAWREVRALDPELSGWTWENRYDARLQLRAIVVMNRSCFRRVARLVDEPMEILAMCDAGYNGGIAGMLAERRACAAAPGCDPDRWFGNVELHCLKSKVKWKGYGASACDTNRGHVRAVMVERRPPYARWFGETRT